MIKLMPGCSTRLDLRILPPTASVAQLGRDLVRLASIAEGNESPESFASLL